MIDSPEWLALLRAVCLSPADDLPRLVYADWLDERGEPERAEQIRLHLSCEPNTHEYDRAGIIAVTNAAEWWPEFTKSPWRLEACGLYKSDRRMGRDDIGLPAAIVRRGFVEEIRLPLAAFWGEPCERCGGRRDWHDALTGDGHCYACNGTGRTGGLPADFFARHPVTTVALSDREPSHSGGEYAWFDGSKNRTGFDNRHHLPVELHALLAGGLRDGNVTIYPSREAALADLCAACVAWGRERAGLEPLAPEASR